MDRPLSETEQEFAAAVVRYGEVMTELRELGAKVRDSGGDAKAAFLSTIESESDRAIASVSWPTIALAFGL